MVDGVNRLKARARALHRGASAGDDAALARLRRLPDLAGLEGRELSATVRRRHCLAVVARELGFDGWPHARSVLRGDEVRDFGTLLYPRGCAAHWNIWSADYDEARRIRAEHGGYLLAWRRHFLIVDRHFVETLGLDPDDPDWERIGRDWVRPTEPEARARLYAALVASR